MIPEIARPHKGILAKDRTVVPTDNLMEWAEHFETTDRVVAQTAMRGWPRHKIVVSTVFLGLDHSHGLGPAPLWFETMVFCGDFGGGHTQHYTTWEEAEAGHAAVCAQWRWKQYYYPITDFFERLYWRVRAWAIASSPPRW